MQRDIRLQGAMSGANMLTRLKNLLRTEQERRFDLKKMNGQSMCSH